MWARLRGVMGEYAWFEGIRLRPAWIVGTLGVLVMTFVPKNLDIALVAWKFSLAAAAWVFWHWLWSNTFGYWQHGAELRRVTELIQAGQMQAAMAQAVVVAGMSVLRGLTCVACVLGILQAF